MNIDIRIFYSYLKSDSVVKRSIRVHIYSDDIGDVSYLRTIARVITESSLIIWLAPWAGKMNQILRFDWLAERARWSHLARSGLPTLSRKKNFPESHLINPLLTKLVRSRWLDTCLVMFLPVYGLRFRLGPWTRRKRTLSISSLITRLRQSKGR